MGLTVGLYLKWYATRWTLYENSPLVAPSAPCPVSVRSCPPCHRRCTASLSRYPSIENHSIKCRTFLVYVGYLLNSCLEFISAPLGQFQLLQRRLRSYPILCNTLRPNGCFGGVSRIFVRQALLLTAYHFPNSLQFVLFVTLFILVCCYIFTRCFLLISLLNHPTASHQIFGHYYGRLSIFDKGRRSRDTSFLWAAIFFLLWQKN